MLNSDNDIAATAAVVVVKWVVGLILLALTVPYFYKLFWGLLS